MAYPFPPVKRVEYNWTFLKDVSFKFEFGTLGNLRVADLTHLFRQKFEINDESHISLSDDRFEYIDGSGNVKITGSSCHLDIRLRFPRYRSFKQAKSWLSSVMSYFDAIGKLRLTRVCVIKYNELMYSLGSESVGVDKAIRQIFSKNLLGEDFDKLSKNFTEWPRWEREITYIDGNDHSEVSIVYGYSKKMDAPLQGVLTMITKAALNSEIAVSDLEDVTDRLNELLDRAFHWSVTEDILSKMREKR